MADSGWHFVEQFSLFFLHEHLLLRHFPLQLQTVDDSVDFIFFNATALSYDIDHNRQLPLSHPLSTHAYYNFERNVYTSMITANHCYSINVDMIALIYCP